MSVNTISIQVSPYKHQRFTVDPAVKTYIIQLEMALRSGDVSGLARLYPDRFAQEPVKLAMAGHVKTMIKKAVAGGLDPEEYPFFSAEERAYAREQATALRSKADD